MTAAMLFRLRRLFRRAARSEEGASTVEFALIFPAFVTVLFMSVEAGLLTARIVMLERSLDIAVRDLRLGIMENPTHDLVKARICDNVVILPDCLNTVMLEMRPVSRTTWNVFEESPICVDRTADIQPLTTFVTGGENQLMLVRACAVFDPVFPTSHLGLRLPLDQSGGYQVVAMSAFVNEPR